MDTTTAEREEAIVDWLVTAVSEVIGDDDVHPAKPFSYYGIGSAEAVTILGELERWLGCCFPESLPFDHPTIAALARHVAEHLDAYRVAGAPSVAAAPS